MMKRPALQIVLFLLASVLIHTNCWAQYTADWDSTHSEFHLKCNGKHFMTWVTRDQNGTILDLRPHPGDDVNGWGSSCYMQPFLPGATLRDTAITTPTTTIGGVHITDAIVIMTGGPICRGNTDRYGSWSALLGFSYDPDGKTVKAQGIYIVHPDGPLSEATGDLNLFRISSNYLTDVPLLSRTDEDTGDTGDMAGVNVLFGYNPFLYWTPRQGSTFPQDTTTTMTIDVSGQYNNVDTLALGYGFRIAPAYKPGIKITVISSGPEYLPMSFGATYDTMRSRDFTADNVGLTPLILKNSVLGNQNYTFSISLESTTREMASVADWGTYE